MKTSKILGYKLYSHLLQININNKFVCYCDVSLFRIYEIKPKNMPQMLIHINIIYFDAKAVSDMIPFPLFFVSTLYCRSYVHGNK